MNVLIATGLYPPEIGGPATYTKLLEAELPKQDIEVDVLAFRKVRHLPKVIKHIAYFFKVLGRAGTADIIYAQDATSVGFPAFLAAKLRGRRFVVKIVGDQTWEQGRQRFSVTKELDDFPRFSWRWHPYLWLLRRLQFTVVRGADAVIAPSKYLAGIVKKWGVSEARLHVIYNGITFPPPYERPDERPEGTLIVSIGRLVPWKNFRGLLEVARREPSWRVVIIGDGPQREELAAGASENVTLTGALAHEQALGWAQSADVFVLNSTYEGLSHTLIEVMALGTPVIATNIPGNAEVLTDGTDGVLIPTHDNGALHRVITETITASEAREQRIAAAKERARTFAREHTIGDLVALFKELCVS